MDFLVSHGCSSIKINVTGKKDRVVQSVLNESEAKCWFCGAVVVNHRLHYFMYDYEENPKVLTAQETVSASPTSHSQAPSHTLSSPSSHIRRR